MKTKNWKFFVLTLCLLTFANKSSATLVIEKWSMEVSRVGGDYFNYSIGDTVEFEVQYHDVGVIKENYFIDTSLPLCTDPAILPNINCNRTYEGLTEEFYSDNVLFKLPDFIDIEMLESDGNNVDFGAKGELQTLISGEGHRRRFEWLYEYYIGFHFYSSLYGENGGYDSNVDIFIWRYNLAGSTNYLGGTADFKNVTLLSRQAVDIPEPPLMVFVIALIAIITSNLKYRDHKNKLSK